MPASLSPKTGTAVKADPRRWWVLFLFSFVSFNQDNFWVTYSPVSDCTMEYYNISAHHVTMLLNYGPIFFVIVTIPTLEYMRRGMKGDIFCQLTRLCAAMLLFAAVIRMLPVWCGAAPSSWITLVCVHVGQIVIASVGPLVMITPSCLSVFWFPDNEWTTATAISLAANKFGEGAGFLAPMLVNPEEISPCPDTHLPRLLYAQLILAGVAMFLVLVSCPEEPVVFRPPDPADELEEDKEIPSLISMTGNIPLAMWCLALGGIINGISAAYVGAASSVLIFSNTVSGYLCMASTMGSLLGGLLIGPVVDKLSLFKGKNLKNLLMGLLIVCLASYWCTVVSLGSERWLDGLYDAWPMWGELWFAFLIQSVFGFACGTAMPVYYELGAELMYKPALFGQNGEILAGAVIIWSKNFGSFLYLIVLSTVHDVGMSQVITAITLMISIIILGVGVKEEYNRPRYMSVGNVDQSSLLRYSMDDSSSVNFSSSGAINSSRQEAATRGIVPSLSFTSNIVGSFEDPPLDDIMFS